MEKFRMRFINALVALSAFLFMMSSCAPGDEKDFKNTAQQLRKLLSKIEKIEIKRERSKAKVEGKDIFYLNYEERNTFILSKRSEWEKLAAEFKSYLARHPSSRWTDDANFCLVMMYLSISLGGNTYYIEAINEVKSFLKNVSSLHIEDWTKKEFSKIPLFRFIFEPESDMPDKLMKELLHFPEDKRIRRVFTWAIISKLLAAGKPSEARAEMKILQREFVEGKQLAVGLQNMIEVYEQHAEILKKDGLPSPEKR